MSPDEIDRLRHMREAALTPHLPFAAGKGLRGRWRSDLMFQFATRPCARDRR